jgi:hypothetical protein
MDWFAIGWSGFVASVVAAAFFWLLRSFGWSRFSPSIQLGCLFFRNPRSPMTETVGFLLFLLLGSSLIPAAYAYLMITADRASWPAGAGIGAVHGLVVAASLPLLGTVSACVRAGMEPPPGRFGMEWGWPTPLGVVTGHLVYGSIIGAVLASF